ncbi:MAG TPA: hypothetical protein VFB82_23840 [Blastocatellia bacterium]|nr:hypothetical protein [Blastocatellia bacterium]
MKKFFAITLLSGLAACASGSNKGPDLVREAMNIGPINAVEAGDTTMSCQELKNAIVEADQNYILISEARKEAQSRAGTHSAFAGYAVSTGYSGSYGNIFGPLQQLLASKQSSDDQLKIQNLNEQWAAANQRRTYLVSLNNQRCF